MRMYRSGRILNMTYPVARMRSMTSRIFRRYALWMGSDRPIPRGCDVGSDEADVPAIDSVSGVVVKELVDETEDALLVRFEDMKT